MVNLGYFNIFYLSVLDFQFCEKKWDKSHVFQGKVRSWYWNINKDFDAEKQDLAIFNTKTKNFAILFNFRVCVVNVQYALIFWGAFTL